MPSPTVPLSCRISTETADALDLICDRLQMTKTGAISRLVKDKALELKFRTLKQLVDGIESRDQLCFDAHGHLRTDLPVFGGPEPHSTLGIWSWDRTHVLTCDGDNLELLTREEWDEECRLGREEALAAQRP